MRPVERGPHPTNSKGERVVYREYAEARGELIKRLGGEYCSFCEMHLDASLAVEHVQPKSKVPDLETFGKVCRWLDEDPAVYLGMRPSSQAGNVPTARVHFKKGVAIKPDSAKALSEMILLAQKALLEEELED